MKYLMKSNKFNESQTFKRFGSESLTDIPTTGNYVIIKKNGQYSDIYNNFIDSNIGKVLDIDYGQYGNGSIFYVEFENNEEYYRHQRVHSFYLNDIEYFSKDREDVERYIVTRRYNL